jgi:hypothetical protein
MAAGRSPARDHVTDVTRALKQIAEIHEHLAKGEVYRGWRSVPVALSGVVGLVAAAGQSTAERPIDPWSFTMYWMAVASLAIVVGCAEIAWHYLRRSTATDRRQTRQVFGQFLPALVAGAGVTLALTRLNPSLAVVLPGLWALFFGVGVFAARPYVPRASGWVALYYWAAGLVLLWSAGDVNTLSPWTVGGTFGVGQLLAATALYWNLERTGPSRAPDNDGDWRTTHGDEEA